MKKGLVEVHTCFSIDLCEPKPRKCSCRRVIFPHQAEKLVLDGVAQYLTGYDRSKPYEDRSQICLTGRVKQTPRGATIEKAHMIRAYIDGDLEEIVRIDEYGALQRAVLTSITVLVPEDKFNKMEREDWGIPVLYTPGDGRTPGGISERKP